MARINLLPWREELRVQKNQQFGVIFGGFAGVGVLVIAAISFYFGVLIENQESRNQYLKSEITKLEKQIEEIKELRKKRENLLQRIRAVQQLQSNRTEIVHLFDEVVRQMPDGVYLTKLKQTGSDLSVSGVAESNSRVSEFVRKIDESEWMTEPRVEVIQRDKRSALQSSKFTIKFKQSRPKVVAQAEGEQS